MKKQTKEKIKFFAGLLLFIIALKHIISPSIKIWNDNPFLYPSLTGIFMISGVYLFITANTKINKKIKEWF